MCLFSVKSSLAQVIMEDYCLCKLVGPSCRCFLCYELYKLTPMLPSRVSPHREYSVCTKTIPGQLLSILTQLMYVLT
jgi:hypothetical protein